jgi:phosphoserine phosphatase RsbU/P
MTAHTHPGTFDRGSIGDGERRIVDEFRRRLGAPRPPEIAGIELACLHLPRGHEAALVGGDFIDFYSGPNLQQIAVIVGDVAGKGVDAAFDALSAKTVTRTVVLGLRWPPPPGEALREVHNALLDTTLKQGTHVTMVFGLVNGRDGSFSFASAGHPSPLVIRGDTVERPMALISPAIGVIWEAELQPYPSESILLAEGDGVLLFTDGIAEARDAEGRFYEDARLFQALEELRGLPAAQLLERLLTDLTRFAGGPPSDDLALVFLRRCASVDR